MDGLIRGSRHNPRLLVLSIDCDRDVEDIWRDHFDYFYREYDEFIFPMTIHPDVSGRPHVLLMHERCGSSPITATSMILISIQVDRAHQQT